jgi:uncharacterized membrane protein YhaH (DUF805 family)
LIVTFLGKGRRNDNDKKGWMLLLILFAVVGFSGMAKRRLSYDRHGHP